MSDLRRPGEVSVDSPWTVRRLLRWIEQHLEARKVDSPRVSAEILLGHVLACERIGLYMDIDRVPTEAERQSLRTLVARAAKHEPVQYLVGKWPFYGRMFEVSPATLIPRPSTETVVEVVLKWCRVEHLGKPLTMADIGTGTGAIAISIVAELRSAERAAAGQRGCRPLGGEVAPVAVSQAGAGVRCLVTDLVPEAIELVHRNAITHGVADAIETYVGNLYEPWISNAKVAPHSLDILTSNPPYISDGEWSEVLPNVREYEPATALRGGHDGLDVIRPLIADAHHWLRPGGAIFLEIAASQREAVTALLVSSPNIWSDIRAFQDIEGHWRVISAKRR